MLALGMALLAIVDTQASSPPTSAPRDRGFNLAESVLTSEAFVLGRNWPTSGAVDAAATSSFGDTIGTTARGRHRRRRGWRRTSTRATPTAPTTGATWQVNICDDVAGSTVWSDALLANRAYDYNADANNKVWVRAQSTVAGKTRALVGLVQVRRTSALKPKYGLVAGNVSDDLGSATSAITNQRRADGRDERLLEHGQPARRAPTPPTRLPRRA